jgi:hypothetical protein
MSEMTVRLSGCARCEGDHETVTFKPLTHAIELDDGTLYTHWGACPSNGEPILMRVVEDVPAEVYVEKEPSDA